MESSYQIKMWKERSRCNGAPEAPVADASRNRQLAHDAATALLTEPGAAPTVELIARRAGLGVGTVVRAFGGKDALIDAAVSSQLRPVVDRAQHLREQAPPAQAPADVHGRADGLPVDATRNRRRAA